MKIETYTLGSVPSPIPDFYLSVGDPMYFTELWNYLKAKNLQTLADNGYEVRQAETADYMSIQTQVDTFVSDISIWLSTAFQQSDDELPISNLPAIPDFTGIIPWFPPATIWGILAQIGIKIILHFLRNVLNPDTSVGDLTEVLKKFREDFNTSFLTLDDPDTAMSWIHGQLQEIASQSSQMTANLSAMRVILDAGLILTNGEEEVPFLELMARQPLEVYTILEAGSYCLKASANYYSKHPDSWGGMG